MQLVRYLWTLSEPLETTAGLQSWGGGDGSVACGFGTRHSKTRYFSKLSWDPIFPVCKNHPVCIISGCSFVKAAGGSRWRTFRRPCETAPLSFSSAMSRRENENRKCSMRFFQSYINIPPHPQFHVVYAVIAPVDSLFHISDILIIS